MRFLDWFRHSRGVIALRPVLMYYAVEIGSPLFLLGSFEIFLRMFSELFSPFFWHVLDVDLSSLFIVGELHHRV
jgi:hypothetical protein